MGAEKCFCFCCAEQFDPEEEVRVGPGSASLGGGSVLPSWVTAIHETLLQGGEERLAMVWR